jgi:DNA gyrase/topoisomerase IV subunit B
VVLAQPPLYKIEIGKERYYAQDDAAKETFLAAQPANRTPDVQRFKGLGEMNAEQLKETTLDPKTRSLLRVDIDNFVNADATFAQLLGKDPAERYRVIMEEAADVDDLDV